MDPGISQGQEGDSAEPSISSRMLQIPKPRQPRVFGVAIV